MALAVLTAAISVLAGLAAAIAAHSRLWVLAPVRAFAVVAVAAAIAVHILPEAIDAAGWWVLLLFVAGFVAPPLAGRAAGASGLTGMTHAHRRVAAELSYGAVLLHQLGDGLGLGVMTGDSHGDHVHWDFVLGIGAHTVPLVAVVALAQAELGGRRTALVRAAGLFAATALGIALTRVDGSAVLSAGPWLNAAIAGLLFHVLLHDADERDVPRAARPLEALGAAAGAALPFLFEAHDHGALAGALRQGVGDTILMFAPAIVIGGAVAALVAPQHRRSPAAVLALVSGPFTLIGLLVASYLLAATDTHVALDLPRWVSAGAALVLAALALARIATAGFMAWLGRAHAGDHHHH
jgi:hypothetical protein